MVDSILVHKETQRVGDVEVSTGIRVATPEHEKLKQIAKESQTIGAFIDWLGDRQPWAAVCERDERGEWWPSTRPISAWLAEYFDIDERKLEAEKVALLEALRR